MRDRKKRRGKEEISTEFTWFGKCPNGEEVESVAKKIERSIVKWQIVILREKDNRDGKTEAAAEENVSLDPREKREPGRREEERGEWLEIEKKVSKRGGSEEERHTRRREGKKRQNRRNGSAGLSRTSFIFSPRLNIKDNLIIGGFSHTKASRAFSRSSLCLSFHLFLSPFSSVCACSAILSVDDMKALEARRKKTRYMHVSLHSIVSANTHMNIVRRYKLIM